jgi:glycine oxidase
MAGGSTPDVVVIGAGAIGCSAAYYLAQAGASVEVVERGDIGREASWASAGMVSGIHPGDDPLSRFYREGAAMFPEFAAAIREETGIDIGFWRCGSLRICRSADEWPVWEAEFQALRAAEVAVECWSAADIRAHSPALAPDTVGGHYFPTAGQVRPPRFVRALAAGAVRRGVRFRTGEPVIGFTRAGDRVAGVVTSAGTISAGTVVIAAGAWSGEIARFLPRPLPIAPARGQIVLLEMLPPRLPSLVFDGDFYLTPRPDGKLLLGSTVEFAGYDRSPTPDGVHELLQKGLSAAPGLKGSRFVTAWAGLRPYAGREAPLIGPLPDHEEIVLATGHFRTGISPALITGQLVADWITARRTAIPLAPFAQAAPTEA